MNEKYKIVIEKNGSKLTFENNDDSFEINFFSIEENPDFLIEKENERIYESFRRFICFMNDDAMDLTGQPILQTLIYSDDETSGYNLVSMEVQEEGIHMNFSSPFHTNIVISKKRDEKEQRLFSLLFEELKSIDNDYYQSYIDEYFKEGREYKLILK